MAKPLVVLVDSVQYTKCHDLKIDTVQDIIDHLAEKHTVSGISEILCLNPYTFQHVTYRGSERGLDTSMMLSSPQNAIITDMDRFREEVLTYVEISRLRKATPLLLAYHGTRPELPDPDQIGFAAICCLEGEVSYELLKYPQAVTSRPLVGFSR